jgi:predicted enzyme related to lactoylglutathione lyase
MTDATGTSAAPLAARHVLTILAVRDLERSVAFYRAAFGWSAEVEVPVYVQFCLPGGGQLGVYQREGFANNTGLPASMPPAGHSTATELYFHCDDIEAASARLLKAGARCLAPLQRKPWGDDAIYFADPDENVLVLACTP